MGVHALQPLRHRVQRLLHSENFVSRGHGLAQRVSSSTRLHHIPPTASTWLSSRPGISSLEERAEWRSTHPRNDYQHLPAVVHVQDAGVVGVGSAGSGNALRATHQHTEVFRKVQLVAAAGLGDCSTAALPGHISIASPAARRVGVVKHAPVKKCRIS